MITQAVLAAQNTKNTLNLFFKVWVEMPTINNLESMTSPIEDLAFPTVTICPKNPNPDRWGPAIKLFDHLLLNCKQG